MRYRAYMYRSLRGAWRAVAREIDAGRETYLCLAITNLEMDWQIRCMMRHQVQTALVGLTYAYLSPALGYPAHACNRRAADWATDRNARQARALAALVFAEGALTDDCYSPYPGKTV